MIFRKNNKTTSVALLGAGYIADFHITALKTLANVEIKAICDLNRRLAEQFAQDHGIPKVYSDLGQMLEQEQLDAVHVLTPPHIHFQTASQVIDAGVDAYIEKPLCHKAIDCQELINKAQASGRAIGVSHNFLFFPLYENLINDLHEGRLGKIDQLDIVWNKPLGQLTGGPFGAWMLQTPTNILFEVAPHAFAHVIHMIGQPDSITVDVHDPINLPGGKIFYRCWEIRGWKGKTSIRIRLSFIDGYPEHYIHIRGSNASGNIDFENNTYVCQEHSSQMLDVDRFINSASIARDTVSQAYGTLKDFLLSKVKLSKKGGPFQHSIIRTVENFYANRMGELDERIHPQIGLESIELAEWVAREAQVTPPSSIQEASGYAPKAVERPSKVLVTGGTGFIGRALVRQLYQAGYGVRLLSRNPGGCPAELQDLGVELVKGSFADANAVEAALDGIEYVYHLARGVGKTWSDYLKSDVEPTRKVAELCLKHNVKRFFYTSSIAIYNAGSQAGTITEETKAHPGILRTAPYARAKAEIEKILLQLHQDKGLPVVIFRPGVVLGPGGNPRHWGIAAWPYNSVCRLWGDGTHRLPIVLVDDTADAMVRAISIPDIDGESYNLTSAPQITANEYLDEFEKRADLKLKRIPVPAQREYTEALIKWVIKTLGRDPNAAFPSYADCDGRSFTAQFDSSKAEKQLGWSPVKDRQTMIHRGIHIPVDEFVNS